MSFRLADCPQDDDHMANFYRTSGDMVCTECGKKYYDHPYCPSAKTSWMASYYWLHVLCDGSHVKL